MANYFVRSTSSIVLLTLMSLLHFSLLAQKPLIDTGVDKTWPGVSGPVVSNNGKFVLYWIENHGNMSLVLRSTVSGKNICFPNAGEAYFTQDNEKAIFKRNDSIGIIKLDAEDLVQYIKGIGSFALVKTSTNTDLLVYRLKSAPDQLVTRDMGSGREKQYAGIEQYWIQSGKAVLILETVRRKDSIKVYGLDWLAVGEDSVQHIWEGKRVNELLIDEEGRQCAFSVAEGDVYKSQSIWLYSSGTPSSRKIVDDHSKGIGEGDHISDIVAFNGGGRQIFFGVEKATTFDTTVSSLVPLDIWSYKDARLQSEQLHGLQAGHRPSMYQAVVNTGTGKVIRLEEDNEKIISPISDYKPMRFVLGVREGSGDLDNEWNWNPRARVEVYLLSLTDGSRSWIDSALSMAVIQNYVLSYKENYIFYYDSRSGDYYSYCIGDQTRRKLGASMSVHWADREVSDEPDSAYAPYPIAGLIRNEDAILVYDQNDIYELDPTRKVPVINLSGDGRQGRDMEIRLDREYSTQLIDRKEGLICRVFDRGDKKEGLMVASIDSLAYRKTFHLQACRFIDGVIKARDSGIYFVNRMTAMESPNIFMTTDFTTYQPLTDVHPEKNYNWLKTELITWRTDDGTPDQGVLYTPENFNPGKKYPLLVYYYERMSDNLYTFIHPESSEGTLNIPFYVSHGYLVFTPDIHYKVGWPGKSAYAAVVSGVKHLSGRKYIDMSRVGLQGHSFGGFETNYIITHSHLFAAAMSASGMSDFISAYGSIVGDGTSRQRQYEMYRDRIGATLWEKPALYLENSPVLRADKITTPVLLMANKEDDDVPWQQGIEFFTALRRLGKRAWLLQYDGQGHGVDGKAAADFSLRMFQFFNYYLKGDTPPVWMTKGVPAELKGIDSGLEIDKSGVEP